MFDILILVFGLWIPAPPTLPHIPTKPQTQEQDGGVAAEPAEG